MLQALRAVEPPWPLSTAVMNAAAEGGHLPIIKWLCLPAQGPVAWSLEMYTLARRVGHLETTRWLQDNGCPLPRLANDVRKALGLV